MAENTITKEKAIEMAESGWWKSKSALEIVKFQLFEDLLCMDFTDFHGAIEEALGRSVFTHEFANHRALQIELQRKYPEETFGELSDEPPDTVRTKLSALEQFLAALKV